MQDKLFETPEKMPRFEFNQAVTDVFDDMINRSVPFYQHILQQVAQLVGQNARIYDLGCSTGALVPFLKRRYSNFNYVGIDKSRTMIEKAQQHAGNHIQFLEGDLVDGVPFSEPTVIICNLVLQFIHPSKREGLIQNYMQALDKGGSSLLLKKCGKKMKRCRKSTRRAITNLSVPMGIRKLRLIIRIMPLMAFWYLKPPSFIGMRFQGPPPQMHFLNGIILKELWP